MVDREGVVVEKEDNMITTLHAITTRLQSQTLAESHHSTSTSSQDDNAAKVRHHSEPHPPVSLLTDTAKKVKIITFQQQVNTKELTSSYLYPEHETSCNWDTTNNNPPNKRQCRSMSIPNDGELHTRWLQNQARSRLHRPLALRPNSGGSRSKSHQISYHRNSAGSRLPSLRSSLAPSETSTPPESPRSRPSSASSGYFDSPLTSLSNLDKNRCESLQTLPSMDLSHPATRSHGSSLPPVQVMSAKSMPSVADSSSHLSPHKQRLLRCQSQPCVIHERRCGIKRRRTDEQRPSINFNKMKETAFSSNSTEPAQPVVSRLTSPLKIRPTARYAHMFPDRVLQTIASSPQDLNNISSLSSTSSVNHCPPTLDEVLSSAPTVTSPLSHQREINAGEESDSGCSTTDEELCDITNKMAGDSSAASTDDSNCSHHKHSASSTCLCRSDSSQDIMFAMEPAHDSELDIDMIENN